MVQADMTAYRSTPLPVDVCFSDNHGHGPQAYDFESQYSVPVIVHPTDCSKFAQRTID